MTYYPKIGNRVDQALAYAKSQGASYVEIEEKIDGSQFSFRWDGDRVRYYSKRRELDPQNPGGLFAPAIAYLEENTGRIPEGYWLHGEAVAKAKHNIIPYERTPRGGLVLWDMRTTDRPELNLESAVASRGVLEGAAKVLGLEVAPLLYAGPPYPALVEDALRRNVKAAPLLGGDLMEGVVVKFRDVTGYRGEPLLVVKVVSEKFREVGKRKAPKSRPNLADMVAEYATEARWSKAVQRMREDGTHTGTPKDIGALIRLVQEDVMEEEGTAIKERLFQMFRKEITGGLVNGLPAWYKAQCDD